MMKILTLKYDVFLDRIVFVLEDIDCSLGIPSLLERLEWKWRLFLRFGCGPLEKSWQNPFNEESLQVYSFYPS